MGEEICVAAFVEGPLASCDLRGEEERRVRMREEREIETRRGD